MQSWLDINERLLFAYSALFGVACGFLSNHGVLLSSWANLIFWALVGVALGLFTKNPRGSLITGALYGFFLVTSFLYLGYQGNAASIPGFIGLSVVLALVGVGCGVLCTLTGRFFRKKFIVSS